jgi:SSS family solute:Na+ symporter
VLHHYTSEMAQNFWTAIWAWSTCFVATIVISLATAQRKSEDDLKGLVYALTPRLRDQGLPWYKQPALLGMIVLGLTLILNVIFW